MALTLGTRLGPYEIVAPLGAGGMGEVYRARDTKLNREVAIKVLPAAMANDAERMARFEREAQVLASLNHSNIASIYGLEESGGVRALIMELVEGPTLAELLEARKSKVETGKSTSSPKANFDFRVSNFEPLPVAKQIAEALEFAHERGIIHRDLKPANVKVTPDGEVKVLDFGLAKALVTEISDSNVSNSPTISIAATQAGMILGTAAYMSPEQAKGKKVDRRADIWAFGCVLYEMLTGKKTFEGETTSDVLAAVIRAEPDWNALPESSPASIRKLLKRCLEKDSKRRLQAIGEARITIEETLSGADVVPGFTPSNAGADPSSTTLRAVCEPPQPLWRRALPWAVAGTAMIVAVVAGTSLRQVRQPGRRMQFAIPVQSEVGNLALSTDGKLLTFVAHDDASGANMLFANPVGSPNFSLLRGTEGATYPFWSPDDASVGFFASGKLKKVAISGGAPQVIANAPFGRGGSWSSRGVIIYAPAASGALWQVNADGANPVPLTDKLLSTTEVSHRWPLFLPDGDHFLLWGGDFSNQANDTSSGVYMSSLGGKEKKFIVPAHSNPEYANGHLYYMDDDRRLLAVPFDAGQARISGEPVVVADRVGYQTSTWWGAYAAGGSDTVIYYTSSGASLSVLTWVDRTGKNLGQMGEPGIIFNPSISPSGDRTVADIADTKADAVNIWILNPNRRGSSRFSFDASEDASPVWSRDETMIAYRTITNVVHLEIKFATGLQPPRRIAAAAPQDEMLPNSWTPGDQQILCTYQSPAGDSHLVLVEVSTGKLKPFLETKYSVTNGQISPDGKWVAYASNESGEWEIYVTTFPDAQGKWQVSRGGGTEPRWRGDGKEMFYIDARGMLTALPVNTARTFSAGTPSALFPVHGRSMISSTDLYTYDVAKDGKRFLINRYVKPDHIEPLTVVLNATAETKK